MALSYASRRSRGHSRLQVGITAPMFETTVAGSLPKPLWLAEPEKLWPAWKLEGDALAIAKIDATILAVKRQEDAGIDIVSDGEQARHPFRARLSRQSSTASISRSTADDRHSRRPLQGRSPDRDRPHSAARGPVHKLEAGARAHTKTQAQDSLCPAR